MRAKKDAPPQPSGSVETWKRFENMRANIRLLHAKTGLSATAIGKEVGFAKHYRFQDLEDGRGTPKLDEIEAIAKYFEISLDDLLYKKARITFE